MTDSKPSPSQNLRDVFFDWIHFGSISKTRSVETIKDVDRGIDVKDGLYVGAAGLMNMTHIALLKPGQARLADVNALQTLFWTIFLAELAETKGPAQFYRFLKDSEKIIAAEAVKIYGVSLPLKSTALSHVCHPVSHQPYLYRQGASWFQSGGADHWWIDNADAFGSLQGMARRNEISAHTLDYLDRAGCEKLGESFSRAASGVIYSSNIRSVLNWTKRPNANATEDNFWRNMDCLLINADHKYVIEDRTSWELAPKPRQLMAF